MATDHPSHSGTEPAGSGHPSIRGPEPVRVGLRRNEGAGGPASGGAGEKHPALASPPHTVRGSSALLPPPFPRGGPRQLCPRAQVAPGKGVSSRGSSSLLLACPRCSAALPEGAISLRPYLRALPRAGNPAWDAKGNSVAPDASRRPECPPGSRTQCGRSGPEASQASSGDNLPAMCLGARASTRASLRRSVSLLACARDCFQASSRAPHAGKLGHRPSG